MRKIIVALITLLLIVRQDFWWWDRAEPLLFGVIPIGLTWQAGISIAASLSWLAAVAWCWPVQLEVEDSAGPGPSSGANPVAREGHP